MSPSKSIQLKFQRFYVEKFANGAINPSAKVVELINSGDHGSEKDLVTAANDVLFRPLAMAIYGGATPQEIELLIKSSTATFNYWMDMARSAASGDAPKISIDGISRDQLLDLRKEIALALDGGVVFAIVDDDDFS